MFNLLKETIKSKADNIISFWETALEIDIRYFLKGGFYQFFTYGMLTVLGFSISVFMARFWDKATFGKWQLIVGIVNTLFIFSLQGMSSSIAVASAKNNDQSLISGVKARMKWSLLGTISFLLIAAYFWILKQDVELSKIFLAMSLIFPFYSSLDSIVAFYNAKKNFSKSATIQLSIKAGVALTTISLLFFYNNFFLIVIANFLIAAILYGLYYLSSLKELSKKEDPETVIYGIKLSISQIMLSITAYADKLLIPLFLNIESLAVYSIALTVPDLFNATIKYFNAVLFPKVVDFDKKQFLQSIQKKWIVIFLFSTILFFAAIIMSFIIPFLFGEKYSQSINYSILMSASIPFIIFYSLTMNFLISKKMAKQLLILQTTTSSIRFILLIILIYFFGIIGASIVYASYIPISSIIAFYLIKKSDINKL